MPRKHCLFIVSCHLEDIVSPNEIRHPPHYQFGWYKKEKEKLYAGYSVWDTAARIILLCTMSIFGQLFFSAWNTMESVCFITLLSIHYWSLIIVYVMCLAHPAVADPLSTIVCFLIYYKDIYLAGCGGADYAYTVWISVWWACERKETSWT